jgi:hypothetical protein
MEPVDSLYPIALAGFVAGILTYCDLDAVFDTPPIDLEWRAWLILSAWWWGFILVNAMLAAFMFYALRGYESFRELNPWLAAFVAGAGYTALVRLKFTTLPNNAPLGVEALYEGLKKLVHRRINRVVRAWRMQQCAELARTEIAVLRQRALLMVGSDALLTEEQRNSTKAWIDQMTSDTGTSAADRRLALALFIITERKTAKG